MFFYKSQSGSALIQRLELIHVEFITVLLEVLGFADNTSN